MSCLPQRSVAESVEHRPREREIGSSIPDRVRPMPYQIDICYFLAWCLALIGYGKNWLVWCNNNVTEWDIGLWCQQPDIPMVQHYKVTIRVPCQKSVAVLGWDMKPQQPKQINNFFIEH